jgi:hypothetical protein
MDDDEATRGRLSFLDRPLPPSFELRLVELGPGTQRVYDPEEWRGALVVVERGEVELECVRGGKRVFSSGAVLWLFGLPLRTLHNRGREAAVLSAVSRRRG